MRTSIYIFLVVFFQMLCSSSVILATEVVADEPTPISRRYAEAKFYYNQLLTNSNLAASRENWLKGTRNFRRIYLSSPKSELAPGCLFMLGRIYHDGP